MAPILWSTPGMALGLTLSSSIAFLSSLTEHSATVSGSEILWSSGFSNISPNGRVLLALSQRTIRRAGHMREHVVLLMDAFAIRRDYSIPAIAGALYKKSEGRTSSWILRVCIAAYFSAAHWLCWHFPTEAGSVNSFKSA